MCLPRCRFRGPTRSRRSSCKNFIACGWRRENSRRAEAVVTAGIIRPLRIAEIGRAAGERVGLHRLPDRIGKIRAGFHHDGLSTGPLDVETELIRLEYPS